MCQCSLSDLCFLAMRLVGSLYTRYSTEEIAVAAMGLVPVLCLGPAPVPGGQPPQGTVASASAGEGAHHVGDAAAQ